MDTRRLCKVQYSTHPTNTTHCQEIGNGRKWFWKFLVFYHLGKGSNLGKGQFFCHYKIFLFLNKIHFFLLSSVEETSNLCYRLNKNQLKLSLLSKIELKDGVTLVPEKLSWVSSDLGDIVKHPYFRPYLSLTHSLTDRFCQNSEKWIF